jgi:uncharacterized protein YndB with AHSA1/START domain
MMNAETPKRSESVLLECELEAPPEKVWRALTEPALLARWLLPIRDPQPESAGSLAFAGEAEGLARRIDCRVVAAEPPRRLSYGWRGNEDGEGESVVTFELTESPAGGTRLKLVHDGFDTASMRACADADPLDQVYLPSPRRNPRIKSGEGSRATGVLLQPWIPAFAGMTKEGKRGRRAANDNVLIVRCAA